MRSFHEQRLKDEKERGKSFDGSMRPKSQSLCGAQAGLPTMIDTRPWIYRKAVGEIPYCEGVSFFDLLEKDPKSGAQVMKPPWKLREIFDKVPDLAFKESQQSPNSYSKYACPTQEVIFTC